MFITSLIVALVIGTLVGVIVGKLLVNTNKLLWGIFAGVAAATLVFAVLFWVILPGLGFATTDALPDENPPQEPTQPVAIQTVMDEEPIPATQPPAEPTATRTVPQTQCYPLSGQAYTSPQGDLYQALWTCDGRLWQPFLPVGNLRVAHSVAITLEVGNYAFDGVECALFVDATRNGNGASNPMTAGYGNDLRFSINTADNGQAWALVECRGNFSTGFQIRWLGPLLQ